MQLTQTVWFFKDKETGKFVRLIPGGGSRPTTYLAETAFFSKDEPPRDYERVFPEWELCSGTLTLTED